MAEDTLPLPEQKIQEIIWDEAGARREIRAWTPEEVLAYAEQYAAARVDQAVAQERARWVAALNEEMVSCHIGVFNDGDDPRNALNNLLAWAQKIALDPNVSSDAQALIDRGAAQERERAGSPSPQPRSAWRPIEEAPRDGTRVLLFDAERTPSEMIGAWRRNAWWGDLTPSGRCTLWGDDSGCSWQPLPPPPSAGKEKAG